MTVSESIMNIAQGIKMEGFQQGLERGKQLGIEEGKKLASLEIARQMLEEGMDRQSVMKFTGLSNTDMKKLFNDEMSDSEKRH